MNVILSYLSDEDGLETVEYAIIIGFIVGALVIVIAAIGAWVKLQFTGLKTDIGA